MESFICTSSGASVVVPSCMLNGTFSLSLSNKVTWSSSMVDVAPTVGVNQAQSAATSNIFRILLSTYTDGDDVEQRMAIGDIEICDSNNIGSHE